LLSDEEPVHNLGTAPQFGHDDLPVDRLGRCRAAVPDQVGDVLERCPVGAEQGHEGMAHIPRHPVGTQTCRLGDLPELAEHIVTIKGRANGRSEDQDRDLPRAPQPAADPRPGGLDAPGAPVPPAAAATGRADTSASWYPRWPARRGKPRRCQHRGRLPSTGAPGIPRSSARSSPRAPHRRTGGNPQRLLSLLQGQALGRTACPSGRGLDQGGHVPADQIPDFGMPDSPLQAQTGDLETARG